MEYYPNNASQNYGDAVEGAKTAAFRRCAKEFGVGLQAWKKDFCEGWWKRRAEVGSRIGRVNNPKSTPEKAATSKPKPSEPRFPSDAFRSKMIADLKVSPGEANREIVTEYF